MEAGDDSPIEQLYLRVLNTDVYLSRARVGRQARERAYLGHERRVRRKETRDAFLDGIQFRRVFLSESDNDIR